MRLVYIEDEVDHQRLVRMALALPTSAGGPWEVRTYASLAAALPDLQAGWPSVLLLDLRLGEEDGEAAFARIAAVRAQFPELPIAVLSVNDFPHWVRRVRALGVGAFIRKPFDVETLGATLQQLTRPT